MSRCPCQGPTVDVDGTVCGLEHHRYDGLDVGRCVGQVGVEPLNDGMEFLV